MFKDLTEKEKASLVVIFVFTAMAAMIVQLAIGDWSGMIFALGVVCGWVSLCAAALLTQT